MYKEAVHDRMEIEDPHKLYHLIGLILIRVVEDGGLEEWADQLCLEAWVESLTDEDEDDWDSIFEDNIGQNETINDACVGIYMQYYM